ncbi:haloacid dehalogenase superfamily, subfamily IA, variant 3 with third motif having DD or ED [Oscillibacter sp. PC13]|uniref:HAD family hydrolase n=1 Tax=Oscillibacter sp. PC13 TaxID=1855299 RepID=UPI0008F26489|nr:HAD family phosphatase [Oscillibacter sp. PC13]SFP88448.1 haloacid dehalogenase superfamily, subfamily IA, variant 3 with third motif having DD or ED [Oscillibacter sp. PC13]
MQTKNVIQLVTFDLDGTMLDDEWAHAEANRRIGERLGVDHTRLGKLTGYSVRLRWQELCRQAELSVDIEELADEHFQITLDLLREAGTAEAPGLTETLSMLKADGYLLAVAFSSDEPFVRAVVELLRLTSYVDFFLTKNQVEKLKPSPEIYLTACRLANVSVSQAVGIEDSDPGCLALRRAGMYSIGFTNGGKNRQQLADADARISSMRDLLPLLEKLQRP